MKRKVNKRRNKVIPTLVVNLLAGPGAGKSTIASSIFTKLKWSGINCEIASEYAKDLTWEKRFKTFENQVYMFGKQHHRIFRLVGQVRVIITDSPLLLTPIYGSMFKTGSKPLNDLALFEFGKAQNMTFFIKRMKDYEPKGRNQTEKEAKSIDRKIKRFLQTHDIPFIQIDGDPDGAQMAAEMVINNV